MSRIGRLRAGAICDPHTDEGVVTIADLALNHVEPPAARAW